MLPGVVRFLIMGSVSLDDDRMTANAEAPFVSVAPPKPLPATSSTFKVLDFHMSNIGANSASSRSASAKPSETIPHFSWLKTSASFRAEASSRSLADRSRVLSFGPILMHESNNGLIASSLHRLPAASNSPISGNFGSTLAKASPNTSPKERCDGLGPSSPASLRLLVESWAASL